MKLKCELKRTAPILIVWDGALWHRSKEVKKWLDANHGVVELMRFPAYSPNLNPQEKVWKTLRAHLFSSLVRDPFDLTVIKAKRFFTNKKFYYQFV